MWFYVTAQTVASNYIDFEMCVYFPFDEGINEVRSMRSNHTPSRATQLYLSTAPIAHDYAHPAAQVYARARCSSQNSRLLFSVMLEAVAAAVSAGPGTLGTHLVSTWHIVRSAHAAESQSAESSS